MQVDADVFLKKHIAGNSLQAGQDFADFALQGDAMVAYHYGHTITSAAVYARGGKIIQGVSLWILKRRL